MNIYLAGLHGRENMLKEFIQTCQTLLSKPPDKNNSIQSTLMVLESFYYMNKNTLELMPYYSDFLLDSGAFSFMTNSKTSKNINWDEYIDKYIAFINQYDIKHFFELDIDSIVGYDAVLDIRKRINRQTGKLCIPVWHKSRGIGEFKKMCSENPYVAIGGIVAGEFTKQEKEKFPLLIREAHRRGSKIHGLGFTNVNALPYCHFDSVDSTAWATGNRFGAIYKFTGTTMVRINKKDGQRLKDHRWAAVNNFSEWIKFQRYALTHL